MKKPNGTSHSEGCKDAPCIGCNKTGHVFILTNDLIGPALNWAVAKCEKTEYIPDHVCDALGHWHEPTAHCAFWEQGGPIIEREGITIKAPFDGAVHYKMKDGSPRWVAVKGVEASASGHTPLVAAMRCYVASKLGDEVEIPEELK